MRRMGEVGPGHRGSGLGTRDAPVAHGGDLDAARALFPGAPEPWLDLSTGINPVPYPCPALPPSRLARLPSAEDDRRLRAAAALAYGASDPASIVAAPGTQILIETLPRLRRPGRVAVLGPTYAEHAAAWARGGHAVEAVTALDALAEADVAVVVNPNNPDGRRLSRDTLLALAADMAARDGLLVVDEAFADLEPEDSLCGDLRPGLAVLRSFGKTYGLAGLRLGFALAEPALVTAVARALGPWAVSGPAGFVGAAALSDLGWRAEAATARLADAGRLDRMILRGGGRVVGGTALFRTADFEDGPGTFARLGLAGIYVRRFEQAPQRLRFGLPATREDWCRLSRVLK
ncbi:threonine-phosphate decarboxylase [Methylobacterium sp.]|nr:threonine-phosphate decarboxylase [Methylobacterium sp.]